MRPEVVLGAKWRGRANLKSPIDSRQRSPISVSATFFVDPLHIETGSSFGRKVVTQKSSDVTKQFDDIGFL
jgi:hypothetical protein